MIFSVLSRLWVNSGGKSEKAVNYLKYLITEDIYILQEKKEPGLSQEKSLDYPAGQNTENLVNKTLVIMNSAGKVSLTEGNRELLFRILQAVQEDPGKIIQFDMANPGPHQDFSKNYHLTNCRVIGFLNTIPESFREIFATQKYMIRTSGNFESLLADPLDEIEGNRSKKKMLWEKLQHLFRLNP